MDKIQVLFEDDYIIGCIKPYGVLSQGNNDTFSMSDLLSKYRTDKGEGEYIGVVHRLDATTGGVMIFSKTPKMTALLNSLIANKKLQKTYLAVVQGVPNEKTAELKDLMFRDKQKNKSYVVKRMRKGVREAVLKYDTLCTKIADGVTLSLLKIKLETGRTHQIRVQLAYRHMPLAGDKKYGSKILSDNIMLWSYEVQFCHPVTGDNICISMPPSIGYFDAFKDAVK